MPDIEVPSGKTQKNRTEWKTVVLFILLCVLVIADFIAPNSTFSFSPEILVALSLITLILLSKSFDKLAIGKLFVIEGNLRREEKRREQAETRNDELIKNFVAFSTNLNLANSNRMDVNLLPPDLMKRFGVTPAADAEIEESERSLRQDEKQSGTTAEPTHSPEFENWRELSEKIPYRVLEHFAISKALKERRIEADQVLRNVRFTSAFESLDPIMERSVVFDGYYSNLEREIFFHSSRSSIRMPFSDDRLYVMLSKIYFYRRAKNTDSKLVYVVYELPEKYTSQTSYFRSKDRALEQFRPAVDNNLLEIETIKITEEEIQDLIKNPGPYIHRRAIEHEKNNIAPKL